MARKGKSLEKSRIKQYTCVFVVNEAQHYLHTCVFKHNITHPQLSHSSLLSDRDLAGRVLLYKIFIKLINCKLLIRI